MLMECLTSEGEQNPRENTSSSQNTTYPASNILDKPSSFDDSVSSKYRASITNPLMIPVLMIGIPVYNGYNASVEFGKDIWKRITD